MGTASFNRRLREILAPYNIPEQVLNDIDEAFDEECAEECRWAEMGDDL